MSRAVFSSFQLFVVFSLLCGLTEKLKKEFQSASSPCGQFYALRFMFLLTALRPELRAQLKQVSILLFLNILVNFQQICYYIMYTNIWGQWGRINALKVILQYIHI